MNGSGRNCYGWLAEAEDEPRSGVDCAAGAFMNGSERNCYGWLAEQKKLKSCLDKQCRIDYILFI